MDLGRLYHVCVNEKSCLYMSDGTRIVWMFGSLAMITEVGETKLGKKALWLLELSSIGTPLPAYLRFELKVNCSTSLEI